MYIVMGGGATLVVVVIFGLTVWFICKCRRDKKEKADVTPIGPTT